MKHRSKSKQYREKRIALSLLRRRTSIECNPLPREAWATRKFRTLVLDAMQTLPDSRFAQSIEWVRPRGIDILFVYGLPTLRGVEVVAEAIKHKRIADRKGIVWRAQVFGEEPNHSDPPFRLQIEITICGRSMSCPGCRRVAELRGIMNGKQPIMTCSQCDWQAPFLPPTDPRSLETFKGQMPK